MRAIIQRVVSAGVEVGFFSSILSAIQLHAALMTIFTRTRLQVEGRLVSEIGPGLLVLVGIHESDVEADADYMRTRVEEMEEADIMLLSNEIGGRTNNDSLTNLSNKAVHDKYSQLLSQVLATPASRAQLLSVLSLLTNIQPYLGFYRPTN
ncbi:hypothetical protein KSP40_PGU022599 [Platanthera guangdongensis]|uniref:Uncharacterized protein n=1 Tax=Platanthera guangdongensis TaxID=2320717 RepID=A0ABR2LGJ9_9ASPA